MEKENENSTSDAKRRLEYEDIVNGKNNQTYQSSCDLL
jgi:hypothetical protein